MFNILSLFSEVVVKRYYF